MKYRAEYTLRFERDPDPAIVGESIEVREALCQFTSVDVKRRVVHIDVTVPVETDGLTLGTGPEPQRGVVVPEQATATKIAQGLTRVLAFARGHAVHLSARGSELLPETDHDRDVLNAVKNGKLTLLLSEIVIRELEDAPGEVRVILTSLPRGAVEKVEITEELLVLRDAYIKAKILTNRWADDAAHVAAATIARADAIVSWNFRHIVRLDKMKAYNQVNLMHGYGILTIISPKEVLADE